MSDTQPPTEPAGEPHTYRYEPSGIRERSGRIPAWLKLAVLGLIIWGLYYGIRYWNSY
jgi:hypothetical protein